MNSQIPENDWFVNLPINYSTVEFKIDTGADITVMSQAEFKRLPHRFQLVTKRGPITSPGGEVKSTRKFLATSEYKGQKYKFSVIVIKGPYSHNILRRSVATRMVMEVDSLDTVVLKDVFGDIGLLNCEPEKLN